MNVAYCSSSKPSDDHVFLQASQVIDTSCDCGFG
jgi:hypothetical protein